MDYTLFEKKIILSVSKTKTSLYLNSYSDNTKQSKYQIMIINLFFRE